MTVFHSENHHVSDHKNSSHNNLLGIIMPDWRTIHFKEIYFVKYLISVRIIMGNSSKNFSEISIFPVLTQLTISPHPMTDGDKWSYRKVCWFMFLIQSLQFLSSVRNHSKSNVLPIQYCSESWMPEPFGTNEDFDFNELKW